MSATAIPLMTDPMSVYWKQPAVLSITLTEESATMSRASFEALNEYSASIPTGKYVGKMWKKQNSKGEWFLCWYDENEDPTLLTIYCRRIIII